MIYESINWEEEAQRVKRAFGIERPLKFINQVMGKTLVDGVCNGSAWVEDKRLVVIYDFCGAKFELWDMKGNTNVCVYFDGSQPIGENKANHGKSIAKALYHLSLLTPAVEQALGVSISAHEKLEWELEYGERLKALGS